MGKSDYEKWLAKAEAVERTDNPLNVPYHVALREAGVAAAFVERYWEPAGDRPGLRRVRKRVPQDTPETIRSLVRAVQEAQTRLLLLVDPVIVDVGDKARAALDELEASIEFALDDGVHDEADDKLAKLKAFHAQDGHHSAELAQALRDYAALADELGGRLVEADEEFDLKRIAEARKLAEALMVTPASPASQGAIRDATRVRNQLLYLLVDQVGNVRRAAAHVFVRQPEIVREVTSGYERRRRAEARRKRRPEPV